MAKIRILLIIDSLCSGGAQNQLTLLAIELKKKGYDVLVYTYYPQDFFISRLENHEIRIIHELKINKIGLNVIRKLTKTIQNEKIDITISFLDTPNFYNVLCAKISNRKVKTIISYRSMTNFKKLDWISLKIKKWTNRHAEMIISNSHHERKRWCTYFPKLKNKFRTIYNFVDLEKFSPIIKYENKKLRFLVVGTVCSYKNGDAIIDGFGDFKKSYQSINFEVIWIGRKFLINSHKKDYFNRLDEKIDQNNLRSNWTWKEPHLKIHEEYQGSDCLVLASKVEGLPNVACEGMSTGLPILISNVLDHHLLVEDGQEGFLFHLDDEIGLFKKLEKFCSLSVAERNQMGLNSRKKAAQLFSKEKFMRQYQEIFKEINSVEVSL